MSDREMKIIALNGNLPLARNIGKQLGVKVLEISETFPDTEIKPNISESVRGSAVYIIQSTSSTEKATVNDNIMELLITMDAVRRASASEINIVIPYYGYARQDRKAKSREPITARLVADLIERAGANRVLTFDLHANQIQGFFDIPMDHMTAAPILSQYLIDEKIANEDSVIVSPDHGGVTRARQLNEYLGLNLPIAIIDKKHDVNTMNKVDVGAIIGDVKGKRAIMIDDMIDTGGTISKGASLLKQHGATDVYVVATHGVLSKNAPKTLQESVFEKVILTDSIDIPESKHFEKLEIVAADHLLARAIESIQNNISVSPLFQARFD